MLVLTRGHEVETFEHLPDGTIVRVNVVLFTENIGNRSVTVPPAVKSGHH